MTDDVLARLKSAAPRVMADLAYVECGDGWESLLTDLVRGLEALPDPPLVVQLKEKHGGLRCYLHAYTPEAESLIANAERRAFMTCERCGADGMLRSRRGWSLVRCEPCAEAEE